MIVSNASGQKTYVLTPRCKPVAKAIARKSSKKVADECLSDEKTKGYIISKIGRDVRTEIKNLSSSQSILCSQSLDYLKNFNYDIIIYDELNQKAQYLLSFLMAATQTKSLHSNHIAVICTCAMIILKFRYTRLNLFQKNYIIDIICRPLFKKGV